NIAGDLAGQVGNLVAVLAALTTSGGEVTGPGISMAEVSNAALNLALVIITTFVAFFILRRLAHPLFHRAGDWSQHGEGRSHLLRVIVAVAVAAVVDIAVIALAYVAGNLIA